MKKLAGFLIFFLSLNVLFSPITQAQCNLDVTITADPGAPFCTGETVTLTAIVTGGTEPYSYYWDNAGETTQTIVVVLSGFDHITCTVTDANGCTDYFQIKLTAVLRTINIEWPSMVCEGEELELSVYIYPPFNFQVVWSTGETGLYAHITTSGTYSVTVTNPDDGCYLIDTAYVEVNYVPAANPEISGPETLCPGESAILSVSGGPYIIIIWSTGSWDPTTTITEPGTYNILVVDENFCAGYDTIEIGPGDILPPILDGPNSLCTGQNGSVTVTNASNYSGFIWNTGETTSSILVSTPGTYTVTVNNGGNCSAIGSFTIAPGSSNMTITGTSIPVTSCMSPDGAIDISINPPGSFTFNWSNGLTTEDIVGLLAGSYTITVTENNGCTASATFIVASSLNLPVLTSTISSSTCGMNNGDINLTITPSGSYTFIWSSGQSTEDISNLTAGTYSVTVTSVSSGCTATESYVVTNNNPPINITGNSTPLTSCINPNGAIDITPSPAGTYTFIWSNGSTTEDIQSLAAGIYTVTVTASGSCTSSASFNVTNNTSTPSLYFTPIAATCGLSNGSVDLNALPVNAYSYIWSTGVNTEDLNNVVSGNYQVTVTTPDGCISMGNVTIPDSNLTLTISGIPSPNTSCLFENGAIDVTADPPGTYTYIWSNGETTEDLDSVPAGSYSVTVTMGLTCTGTGMFDVANNITSIDITGIPSPNSSCSQPNGGIDITVSPPGTFTFIWSNGETTEDIQELTGGTYSVTVTDADGCTSASVFQVINTSSTFSYNSTVLPNNSCTSPIGAIDITLSPTGVYTFTWNTGASTEDIQNLYAGNYSVTISDINNCLLVGVFSVPDSSIYPEINSTIHPASCGSNNGAIDITIIPSGGNVFSWSNGSTNKDQFNLPAGEYILTVTGSNGCTSSDTFNVNNINSNFLITETILPNNSCLSPNGSIDLTINPVGSYSFVWSSGATTEDLQNVAAASYSVTITDSLNCSASDTFIVASNTSAPVISANITASNCGVNNGAIDLNIIPPGTNNVLWSTGSITEDLQNIFPGIYSVIVTDTNGCQALDTFNVLNINNNFSLSAVSAPNVSCNSPNGAIDLTVTPGGTYTFSWSNGATSEDLANLGAGSFIVTVTDNNSCSSTAIFDVLNNITFVTLSALITPSACGMNNGGIDVSANPSNGNLFLWSNSATTEDLQNLLPGSYSLTVTGSNGCSSTDIFTVPSVGSSISLSAVPEDNTNCILPNGSIDLSVSPSGSYSFVWSNGNSTEDQVNLVPGNYSVTVTDINGCSSTGSFAIEDKTISPLITESVTTATCGNMNGQINLIINPPGIYFYAWSNGGTDSVLLNVPAGIYSVSVTSDHDCMASTIIEVPDTTLNFSISAIATNNTSCSSFNGMLDLTITPAGIYNFFWSNGATTEDVQFLQPGLFTVTVTDNSSCSSTSTFAIDNDIIDFVVAETITPVLCGEANGGIDLTIVPPSGNTYSWSNGSSNEDLSNLTSGIYSVTVTGQNGCTWSSAFNVPASPSTEIELHADMMAAGHDSVTITVEVNIPLSAVDTLIWLPENLFTSRAALCLEQTILKPSQQTEIMVMVVDTNGCITEARLLLDDEANLQVYIPNVFTPNGDGINDLFTLYGNKNVEQVLELRIFDRWGNLIFVNNHFPPNEVNYGWDGSFRNLEMNPEVYVYWARVRFLDGSERFYKGDITLVR